MEYALPKCVQYVGVDDLDLDLFEGQYAVPQGMSYNSFVVTGPDAVALLDTADHSKQAAWLSRVRLALGQRKPDYLVLHHLEPDHSGCLAEVLRRWPELRLVCSKRAAAMLPQFCPEVPAAQVQPVGEGDTLPLGEGVELQFMLAPMVHWPEVMVSYLPQTSAVESGVFFSADGFGKFGALCHENPVSGGLLRRQSEGWACEARRYYFNICGKYGAAVQQLLAKVSKTDVRFICPLHGPVLTAEALTEALRLYDLWSRYQPETHGVFIAHCSLHGATTEAALLLAEMLRERGVQVSEADLLRSDLHECVEDAFRYDRLVLCAPTYDGGLMPAMDAFLRLLQAKSWQHRRVALVENGSWSPQAARKMRDLLETMKAVDILPGQVTLRTRLTDQNRAELLALSAALCE